MFDEHKRFSAKKVFRNLAGLILLALLLGAAVIRIQRGLVFCYQSILCIEISRGVPSVLHTVLALALSGGSQLCRKSKHVVQRRFGYQSEPPVVGLYIDDETFATCQHGDGRTLELFWSDDFDVHDWLEHDPGAVVEAVCEGELSGLVEGPVRGINLVVSTVLK